MKYNTADIKYFTFDKKDEDWSRIANYIVTCSVLVPLVSPLTMLKYQLNLKDLNIYGCCKMPMMLVLIIIINWIGSTCLFASHQNVWFLLVTYKDNDMNKNLFVALQVLCIKSFMSITELQ
jgi:hypothetical protein